MPTIRANDVELFYDLSGPEDAPVVVFSHSVGATLEMWDAQVRALSRSLSGSCATTPAGTGAPQVVDRPTSIDELADDLAGLLDALGIAKAHLVGLSLGGMTAQALRPAPPGQARKPRAPRDLRLPAAGGGLDGARRDSCARKAWRRSSTPS